MSLDPLPFFNPSRPLLPLRFHAPTSAPHLRLQPDHLTATHVGPGNHPADHSLLHTERPITFASHPHSHSQQQQANAMEAAVELFYFEVKLLNAGKRGELYVGLVTGDSPAIDSQLTQAIREGKVRGGANRRHTPSGHAAEANGSKAERHEEDEEDEEEQEAFAPSSTERSSWMAQSSAAAPSAASLSQPAAASTASSTPYSSSAQRQLGLEHPHSFAIQLTHGRLYSQQHTKGLSCLPSLAAGDTLGIGFVHNALTSTAAQSGMGGVNGVAAVVSATGASAQPLSASSLHVQSYVFFTKNGRLIPDKELSMDHISALQALHSQPLTAKPSPLAALLFPAVSFHSPSESVQATFDPAFVLFDVAQYEAELRDRRLQLLLAVEDGRSGLLSLVREYLLCHGYDGTVRVLDESEVVEVDARLRWAATTSASAESGEPFSAADRLAATTSEAALRRSLRWRGVVRQLIQSADVEGAVRALRQHCPAVLRRPTVRFHLHSLQFINLLTTPSSTTAAQSDGSAPLVASSSPVLVALHYARCHLSRFLHTASLQPTLGRLLALLALSPSQWSASGLSGLEWRERVADTVNAATLQEIAHNKQHTATATHNGHGSTAGNSDSMEDGEERVEEQVGRSTRDGREAHSAGRNGMEMEREELFADEESGISREEKAEEEKEEENAELGSDLHGSRLEVLLAQLLAVDTVWQQQRPTLSSQPLFAQAALEQLLSQ